MTPPLRMLRSVNVLDGRMKRVEGVSRKECRIAVRMSRGKYGRNLEEK